MGKELCHYMQLQIEWVTNCAWAKCAKKKKPTNAPNPCEQTRHVRTQTINNSMTQMRSPHHTMVNKSSDFRPLHHTHACAILDFSLYLRLIAAMPNPMHIKTMAPIP